MQAIAYSFSNYDEKFDKTLRIMVTLIDFYNAHPLIRQAALKFASIARPRDEKAEIMSIINAVQKIPFRKDPFRKEYLQTPVTVLKNDAGDCDCKSVLAAALLESIGYPTRLRLAAFERPYNRFTHVFPEVFALGNWIPFETVGMFPVGRKPPYKNSRVVYYHKGLPN